VAAHLSQEDQIIAALRRITRAIDLHSRALWQACGLTAPQLATLQEIARHQALSPGAIARAIHLSQPTVAGILNRLEQRGLVTRSRDAPDRRAVTVRITGTGARMLASAPSLLQDRFRGALARLEIDQQTQMLETLQRIATVMDAQQIDASPHLTSGSAAAAAEPVGPCRAPDEAPAQAGLEQASRRELAATETE
jgi:DNA-binding MarR family transcriptional regulator